MAGICKNEGGGGESFSASKQPVNTKLDKEMKPVVTKVHVV